MRLTLILPVLVICVHAFPNNQFKESWSATQKLNYIWEKIIPTKGTETWWFFPWRTMLQFVEDQNKSFEKTDFVQSMWYTFGGPRIKSIHAKGATQKIVWKSVGDHPYTGQFKDGGEGLIHYTIPKPNNNCNWDQKSDFNPGIATKIFRDKVHSSNIMGIHSAKGTEDPNFFKHAF